MEHKPSYDELSQRVQFLEAELRKKSASENISLFQFLTENMADLIWTTDLNFKATYSSPSLERILGYTPQERYQQPAQQTMTPESLARAAAVLAFEMGRDGAPGVDPGRCATIEIENYTKDGATRWMENNVRFIRDAQHQITGLMGVARDITERKLAEARLRESEAKYRHIMTHAPAGIYEIDYKQGRFITVNDAMCEITGYSREELLRLSPLALLTEASQQIYLKRVADALAGEKVADTVEFEVLMKNGEKRWISLRTRPQYDQGVMTGAFVVAHDTTERRTMETALRDSERRFRELAELLPETIFEMDLRGRFRFVNRKAAAQYGYTPQEFFSAIVGLDLIHPKDRRRAMRNFQKIINGDPSGLTEYESVRKDGSTFPSLYHSAPIRQAGNTIGIRGFIIDISEKKSMEARIKLAQKMESIGTLAGGVAHEFNNILGIIIGNCELAIDGLNRNTPVQNYLKEIFAASLRAKEVVQQILRFVSKIPSEKKPLQISAVIQEALPLIRATLPKNIVLRTQIAGGSEIVLANATEIHQIVLNLCANATHAMKDRGGELSIELTLVTLEENGAAAYEGLNPGRHAQLLVRDTGAGIEPGIMDRIFEPYFTTKAVDEGLGMGLAVVYGLVKHCEGAIKVSSRVGQGTWVEVMLPLVEARDLQITGKTPQAPSGSERILFIDDEAALVKISILTLERLGYRVHGETESQSALALFKNDPHRFDLVITDLCMPHMDGERLAQALLQIRPEIPIILCSGYGERIDREQFKRLAIRARVAKPLVTTELARIIRSVLDRGAP
jgi:PAS domain S-box-containing protein